VVPNLENREDWESHLEGILENLSPVGHLEVTLAERIAVLSWRLHRVTRFEREDAREDKPLRGAPVKTALPRLA
jgi:hypothetical protein